MPYLARRKSWRELESRRKEAACLPPPPSLYRGKREGEARAGEGGGENFGNLVKLPRVTGSLELAGERERSV